MKRQKRKKVGRIIGFTLLVILAGWISYHHIMLGIENNRLIVPGQMVEVSGHNMHVYTEGEEKKEEAAIIFLSGSGTAAPYYDFKCLYTKFSSEYQIAVVERAGYGYSEVYGGKRDIDTVLEEDREALKLAGIEPPYVLMAHSIAGIEALYWYQCYPDEVEAIIGLDMNVPESAENVPKYSDSILIKGALKAARFLGIQRVSFFYPITYQKLTEAEMTQARYLTYRNAFDEDILNEMRVMFENYTKVEEEKLSEIYLLDFVSNDTDSRSEMEQFSQTVPCELVYLDCSHYVHQFESERIYEDSIQFLQDVKSQE